MSNFIRFVERARNAEPVATIEAYRLGDFLRYRVRLSVKALAENPDDLDDVMLGTYSLEGARSYAEYFAKEVIEIGPPEAFDDQDGASEPGEAAK